MLRVLRFWICSRNICHVFPGQEEACLISLDLMEIEMAFLSINRAYCHWCSLRWCPTGVFKQTNWLVTAFFNIALSTLCFILLKLMQFHAFNLLYFSLSLFGYTTHESFITDSELCSRHPNTKRTDCLPHLSEVTAATFPKKEICGSTNQVLLNSTVCKDSKVIP